MAQFDRMTLLSVEKAIRKDKSPDEVKKEQMEGATAHLSTEDLNSLSEWIKTVLGKKVNQLKVNDNAMRVFVIVCSYPFVCLNDINQQVMLLCL